MNSSYAVSSFLLLLAVVLVPQPRIQLADAQTSQNITCLFQGCVCTNYSSKIDVICVIRAPDEARPNYFPERNLSSEITTIHNLLISYYNFQTIPIDAFSGLSVKNLLMIGNGLTFVQQSSFRGIKDLKFLLINDRSFKIFLENSTLPIRDTLNSLDLSDSALDLPGLEILLPELRKLGNLNNLLLNYNSLAAINNTHLGLFPNLKRFSLVSNNLAEIQDLKLFQANTQLSGVDLSKNKIKDLSKVLPGLQPGEGTLLALNLAGNQLESVPEIRLVKLQRLDLSQNLIKTISPNAFSALTDLKNLDLSGNQLTALDNTIISTLTKLNVLSLSNNYFKAIPDISNMSDLNALDLSNQNGQLQLQEFAFNRLKSNNLMSINLDDNSLSGRVNNKAFCSQTKRTADIKSVSLGYDSVKSLSVCLLKQLRQDVSSQLIVTGVSSTGNYDACNCDLDNYALASNVDLTGICDQYTTGCKPTQMLDTCAFQPQFACSSASRLLRQSLLIISISLLAIALLI